MAKEGFNWKSLFINEENNNNSGSTDNSTKVTEQKFPEQTPIHTMPNVNPVDSGSNPFLGEILEVYEKGFESLNSQGFDFFELYKSVSAVGITNPQSYQMAFAMGKSLNPAITKEFLLEKAGFYVTEIEKVHTGYAATGEKKKNELMASITNDRNNLAKSISELEIKIAQLQEELSAKKLELEKLNSIDAFTEINQKIEANNIAKQRILESINTVANGVKQYL